MTKTLGGCSGFHKSQMKRLLFLSLFLAGCSGSSYLSKEQSANWQNQTVSYYNSRAIGSFQRSFYTTSDSIFTSVPKSDGGLADIYSSIQLYRSIDSTGTLPDGTVTSSAFWKYTAQIFNVKFNHANAGRK